MKDMYGGPDIVFDNDGEQIKAEESAFRTQMDSPRLSFTEKAKAPPSQCITPVSDALKDPTRANDEFRRIYRDAARYALLKKKLGVVYVDHDSICTSHFTQSIVSNAFVETEREIP